MKNFWILAVISVISVNVLMSQSGGTAASFLWRDSAPAITGVGGAGVAFSVDDATSVTYNPAHLGINILNRNILISYNYNETPTLFPFDKPFTFSNFGINLGYGLDSIVNLPINFGISYIRRDISESSFTLTSENGSVLSHFNQDEFSNEFSMAASFKYYALFSIGATYKMINSELKELDGNHAIYNENAGAFDFGILAKIPIIEKYELSKNLEADLDLSAGMAVLNLGNELNDIEEAPLPRYSSIGYSISTGLTYKSDDFSIKFLNFDWSAASNIVMFRRDTNGISYTGMFSDFDIFDNLIGLNSTGYIQTNHGFRVSLFEAFSYSIGRNYINPEPFETSCLEFSSKGITKIIYFLTKDDLFKNINNNVFLTVSIATMLEKDFTGFNLIVKL